MPKHKIPYSQKYREEWEKLKEFQGWLQRCTTDNIKAYCKYCKCLLAARFADLQKHTKTDKHIQNARPFSSASQQRIQFQPLSVISKQQRKEAQLCMYSAVHTSVRSIDHLSDLHKDYSETIKIHRTKCTQIIKNVIGPHFRKALIEDIGNNPYSLIIDESTDISVSKMLGIVIRYHSINLNKIVTTHLELAHIEDGTAKCITETVKQVLQKHKLPLQNLQGMGTDNAAAMVGVNNGVFALLKSEIPHLRLVRCVCHSLQLALSKSTEKTLPPEIDFLIRETYNWFQSSVRQIAYVNVYKTLNNDETPLKILRMSDTRWISIEPAVKRILDQWETLKDHFNIVRLTDHSADMLYQLYSKSANLVYLNFLYPILTMVQKTNKHFESQTADPTKLLNDLKQLYSTVINLVVNPMHRVDIFDEQFNIERFLSPNIYLGFAFENACTVHKIGASEKTEIQSKCVAFLINLAKELKNRLPDNVNILSSMNMLSVQEARKPLKMSISELASQFVSDNFEINNIENAWMQLHTIPWENKENTELFWLEVAKYRNASDENPFQPLVNLAFAVLCLPHSNADVERLFSQMNVIKSKLRNRMLLDLLDSILHIRFGLKRIGKCCQSYTLPDEVCKQIGTNESYSKHHEDDVDVNELLSDD
ncbi:uncharacterized protein LOC116159845 [Photinus pyralis]|uniref:uncharacterized protein LOC116159782 n=1 Tax=Photinus pyralis TaxID=7054 RepID=UPI0012670BC6|nr:uncharacterized protein LOC116159782 [Photinus pyralis]XP_031328789.1 uncharacterized protein LOC116159845 [Photinus pyralis]